MSRTFLYFSSIWRKLKIELKMGNGKGKIKGQNQSIQAAELFRKTVPIKKPSQKLRTKLASKDALVNSE